MAVVLHILMKGRAFTLGALGSSLEACELVTFIGQVKAQNEKEHDRLLARLQDAVDNGPPIHDRRKSRGLEGRDCEGLYEFKTSGGLRVLYFYDKERLLICSHGILKLKPKELKKECRHAQQRMSQYFEAQRQNTLKTKPLET